VNRALLAFGIVTLALTVLVCFTVYKPRHSRSGAIEEPGVDVVVAANDIQAGTRLEEKDSRVVSFPASLVSSNCLRSKSPVVGRVVIFPIEKSECISRHKVAAENADAFRTSLVPPGMRAVSVPVINAVAPAGRVVPGTRVDVASAAIRLVTISVRRPFWRTSW
jgi:Flp pilus assembly protein CpaB